MRRYVAGMPVDFPDYNPGSFITKTEPQSRVKSGKILDNTGGEKMTAGVVGNPKKRPTNVPIDMYRGANPTKSVPVTVSVKPVSKQ